MIASASVSGEAVGITGLTAPVYDASLGASQPGKVKKILVEEGSPVRLGDVLIEFERANEELEVSRRKLIWKNKAELESAKYRLVTIEKDLEATRSLFKESRSVSEEDLEKKELEFKLAQAAVRHLETAEQREEIEYRMALEQLEHRRITAPADGVVMRIDIEEGEYYRQQQTMLRLVDIDQCFFTCNVAAERSHVFTIGESIPVEFDLTTGRVTRKGKVVFVSPLVDPSSGLRRIKLLLDNKDKLISPGVTGTLRPENPDTATP